MNGFVFLMIAVVANIVTNFCLKTAVRTLDVSSAKTVLSGLVLSPFAWIGLLGAGTLLLSFMAALRTLPLSTAYPILTALAILVMTCIEWWFQDVPIGAYKAAGLTMTVLGVAMLVSHG